MHWVNQARRQRSVKLVVIDPYRTATAGSADVHLALRPGTDAALACAVMHVLLAEGLADHDYLASHTDFSSELEAHLGSRNPAWAAAITGLSEQEIVAFARLYGSTRRSYLRLGYGFTRQRNGAVAMHAASCLPAMTGAWKEPGGGALYSNGGIYRLNTAFLHGLDQPVPPARTLDMSHLGAILAGDRDALRGGPPVGALLVQSTNPATVAPDSLAVLRGLASEELFVCVHEQFMTDTARLADLVLPATTFVEHDDLYQAGGHTFLQASRALIPPPGWCLSNHQFIARLTKRLGIAHPADELAEGAVVDRVLADSGKPSAAEIIDRRGIDCAPPFADAHFLNGFGHPDDRFRFAPDWAALGPDHDGLPGFPDQFDAIDAATPDKPFRLVAAPARHFLNTTFTETPSSTRLEGRPTALLHPDACARLNVAEGDLVRIGNELASVVVHARPFAGLHASTVVVESQWPHAAFAEGLGINALVSDRPGLPAAGAAYHDTAVWVRRTEEAG